MDVATRCVVLAVMWSMHSTRNGLFRVALMKVE